MSIFIWKKMKPNMLTSTSVCILPLTFLTILHFLQIRNMDGQDAFFLSMYTMMFHPIMTHLSFWHTWYFVRYNIFQLSSLEKRETKTLNTPVLTHCDLGQVQPGRKWLDIFVSKSQSIISDYQLSKECKCCKFPYTCCLMC